MVTTQELLANRTVEERKLDDATHVARNFLSHYGFEPFLFVSGKDGVRPMNDPAIALSDVLRGHGNELHDTVLKNIFTSSAIGCREVQITRSKKTGDDLVMLSAKYDPNNKLIFASRKYETALTAAIELTL